MASASAARIWPSNEHAKAGGRFPSRAVFVCSSCSGMELFGEHSNLATAAALIAVFKPEDPSPPLTPEREAARRLLNDAERKILEAMESDLRRSLTEEEEHLALEPGALIEQPRPKNPPDEFA